MSRNYLLNADFSVAQRGTSFTSTSSPANNDDAFTLDRWILLSDGNDAVDVTQQTSSTHLPAGCRTGISLDVETASKKFGILQILEASDTQELVGKRVCFSFKAKKRSGNATVDKLRAAIFSWTSTADTVTSDIVNAWGAEGTNPTLVSNWTRNSDPVDLTLTNSFKRFMFSAEVSSNAANVAVFIWCDNSDATVGDFVDISEAKLELGHMATRFERRLPADELRACKRFYERITHDGNIHVVAPGWARLSTDAAGVWTFSVEKRVTPTLGKSNDAHIDVMHGNATFTSSAISFILASRISAVITATTSGLTAGQGVALRLNTSGAFVEASAEL